MVMGHPNVSQAVRNAGLNGRGVDSSEVESLAEFISKQVILKAMMRSPRDKVWRAKGRGPRTNS